MKLEEVIKYLVDENFSSLEQRNVYGDNKSHWYSVSKYILDNNLRTFLHSEFRIKKEKVKRYNIVYKYYKANDTYFSITCLKFKDKKDFEDTTTNYGSYFVHLVKESEEEFDE